MDFVVRENTARHRFEAPIGDDMVAAVYFRDADGRVVLFHTEVPAEFSGQGLATRLAQGTFELLRQSGRKAMPTCLFMARFIAKHSEYADIVEG